MDISIFSLEGGKDLAQVQEELLSHLLQSRNIQDRDLFFNPPPITLDHLQHIIQDLQFDDIEKAIELISEAVTKEQPIIIHGDYDVDGVSATAILWEAIYFDLGYKNVMPFIPHRVNHGYGLSDESLSEIEGELEKQNEKPGLIITVDCGISSKDMVEKAKDHGFSVIVSDHHTRPEQDQDLPQADAILHSYKLCGAGISWVLATKLREQMLTDYPPSTGLDLVALATLADVQELTDWNRRLVKEGLAILSKTERPGLRALYSICEIAGKPIGTYEVGWVIGPRLNAVGRLDTALDALRLLVVKDSNRAITLAESLNAANEERQRITMSAVNEAIEQVEQYWKGNAPIVVYQAHWHEGIVGLIAGRLTEKFNAPTIALTRGDDGIKGSARSIAGINVVELLRRHEDLMTNMGGHAMAAGLSIPADSLESLRTSLSSYTLDELKGNFTPPPVADAQISLEVLSIDLVNSIETFAPFGIGNPRPSFLTKSVKVEEARQVGKTSSHLQLKFGNNLKGIAFNQGELFDYVNEHPVDLVYNIDLDTYFSTPRVQLKVKQIHATPEEI